MSTRHFQLTPAPPATRAQSCAADPSHSRGASSIPGGGWFHATLQLFTTDFELHISICFFLSFFLYLSLSLSFYQLLSHLDDISHVSDIAVVDRRSCEASRCLYITVIYYSCTRVSLVDDCHTYLLQALHLGGHLADDVALA